MAHSFWQRNASPLSSVQYAPTLDAEHNIKDDFYRALDAILQKTPATDRLILMGDFNARVGTEHLAWCKVIRPAWCGENEP